MNLKWLPNTVTIIRCVLAIYVGYLILNMGADLDDRREPGLWLFVPFLVFSFVAATDWLDGALARGLDAESPLGARLDPIADKLLTGASLLTLAHVDSWGLILTPPALAIVGRDLLITAIREAMGNPGNLKVSNSAKWKTAVALIGIGLTLFGMAVSGYVPSSEEGSAAWLASRGALLAGIVAIWIAAIMSVLTAIDYVSAMTRQSR
ncbi:MAG: CDP-alcohol phosphatidyltransferase family protein [Henriciella sp.]|uniref:CDP-alcohol phosphatidyltransferase family protein n=1 Tax=Henriciella sp. TaxID=1968823 RepID=UPI003C7767B7